MNARDSEFVAGLLIDHGYRIADAPEKADVILFNSCSVRKHAEDRLFSNIGEMAPLKKKNPGLVMGLIGCTAQSYRQTALERAPLLDLVCGPGNEHELPALIAGVVKTRCAVVAADKSDKKRPELSPRYRESGFKAFVSIGEGCDNFCSYCIVPYVRGRERSRDAKDIVREVKELAARGFKEITLLGQNVNSYGAKNGFVGLLESLDRISGIERIRFMTSHPKDAHADLFRVMGELEKVCEHLHLPVQSGSDRMLKLMNRGYTAKKYLRLVELYRKLVPAGSITTDIIVGFPSETEGDFRKTRALMDEVSFDSAFTFKYSPRPPAKAARLRDDVTDKDKAKRFESIVDMQCKASLMRNEALVGKTVEVLVDGNSKKDPKILSGRTRTGKTAVFAGDNNLIGKIAQVSVDTVTPYALRGKITRQGVPAMRRAVALMFFAFCGMLVVGSVAARTNVQAAERAFMEGRYEAAVGEADALIRAGRGKKDELYYLKGISQLKMDQYTEARASFDHVIAKYPRSKKLFDAYLGRGDSYLLAGDAGKALGVYNEMKVKFAGESNIAILDLRIAECYEK